MLKFNIGLIRNHQNCSDFLRTPFMARRVGPIFMPSLAGQPFPVKEPKASARKSIV